MKEIDEHWTLDDLFDAHEYLDIKDDAEAFEGLRQLNEMNRKK